MPDTDWTKPAMEIAKEQIAQELKQEAVIAIKNCLERLKKNKAKVEEDEELLIELEKESQEAVKKNKEIENRTYSTYSMPSNYFSGTTIGGAGCIAC